MLTCNVNLNYGLKWEKNEVERSAEQKIQVVSKFTIFSPAVFNSGWS